MKIISIAANPITALTGYECKTTFWEDFSIADCFGVEAVKDTYNRAFESWKNKVTYLTELVMVLNHKIWQHYEHNDELAEVYNELWQTADEYCANNLTGEDLTYYYNVTD